MTVIIQSKDVRDTLRSIGFDRKDYQVRTDIRCYQRNGQNIREYGNPLITMFNTTKAIELIDRLAEHFIVEVVKRGDKASFVMVRRPTYNEKPGRKQDYQLEIAQKEEQTA